MEFSEKGSKAFNKIELINPNYVIKASGNNLFITNSTVVSCYGSKVHQCLLLLTVRYKQYQIGMNLTRFL
jgi:hypothetical protein